MNHCVIYTLLLTVAVLAGCGTESKSHTPFAEGAITVHCNSSTLRWNACYETAANLCGAKGYQVVASGNQEMPTVTANANEVAVIGEPMVIRCNQ